MNEKLHVALGEVDSERERVRRYDLEFQFTDEDHIWPKHHNSRSSCRCALHNHADGLIYSCYVRIQQAQGGLPLRSALEMAEQLEKTIERAEAAKREGGFYERI